MADDAGAPSFSDTSLGLLADQSNTPGNDDVSDMGPNDVDGDVADPGDGASGDQPRVLLTGGDVGPQASSGVTNGLAGKNATSTADASLGLSAGRSSSQVNDDVSGVGPDDVDGDIADTDGDGAFGDRPINV